MTTRGGGRQSSRGSGGSRGRGGRERQSVVQAMRARGRARGKAGRSPAFELAGGMGDGTPNAASLQQLFRQARASGSLNLTSRNLEQVPDEVFNLIGCVDAEQGEKFWETTELQKLDLSFNQIIQLPDQVSSLGMLVSLKLRKNALMSVPAALFTLKSLSLLDLTGNAIRELPEELGAALAIKVLLLSGNRLSEIPSCIGNLEALETLELSDNALQSLPSSIGNLARLTKLMANKNKLACLPESLGRLSVVSLVDVSRNSIERFPDALQHLDALTLLDARENRLREVPPLPQSDRLAQVFLGFNSIVAVDGAVLLRVSGGLFELHLQNNKIVHLPEEIGSLAKLKTLDVSNNDLAELPAALGYLPQLHRLAVDGNPLRTVRRSLLSGAASSLKKYLRTRGPCPAYPGLDIAEEDDDGGGGGGKGKGLSGDALQVVSRSAIETGTLDLEGRGLAALAAGLFEDTRMLAAVTRIKLGGNRFQTLPAAISRCQSVKALEADNNELGSLPATLADVAIQRVSLRRNRLSSVSGSVDAFLAPSSIVAAPPGSLLLARSIQELDLSSNGLVEVPEAVFVCRGLQTLILGFNSLSDVSGLPWAGLSALETLDLSSNRLVALGDVVAMTWLRRLNIENNEINPVPPELGLCTALESLLVAGNPQRQLTTSLLQKGTGAMLQYLRDRLPPNHRPLGAKMPPPLPPPAGSATRTAESGAGQSGAGRESIGAAAAAVAGQEGVGGQQQHREALERIANLKAEVEALERDMDAPGMSQAQVYAAKKKMQMKRATAMREERALKQAGQQQGRA